MSKTGTGNVTDIADYQIEFIEFALHHGVLKFGEFTLKSGRTSPYFFNAGEFKTGKALSQLGRFYAAAIEASNIEYDLLFGPAYKGIPLVAATSISLADRYDIDKPYVFNRKEAKTHGEGGSLVGAPLIGRVVIVDDVITAGTAIREVMEVISQADKAGGSQKNVTAVAVVVAIDRQERGTGAKSAIQEVEEDFSVSVLSVVNLQQIIAYLETKPEYQQVLKAMRGYRDEYGVSLN